MAQQASTLLAERPVLGGYRDEIGGHQLAFFDADRVTTVLDTKGPIGEGGVIDALGDAQQKGGGDAGGVAGGPPTLNRQSSMVEFDAADEVEVPMVDRMPFNFVVSCATLLNVLVLGLEQDMGPQSSALTDRMQWFALECIFSLFFVVEMLVRISSASKHLFDWFCDLWNLFDLLLVIASIVDTFVLGPSGIWTGIRLFTVLRALRVVRLIRLVRTLPYFRELWLLVGGLANSMKALGWVALIALAVLYVGSIIVTTEIGQNHGVYGIGPSYDGEIWPYEKYFGDVPTSMFSLLQVMTMDGWCDDIVRHVMHRQPVMGIFFILFLFVMAFGLVNVVIGIIVENTLAAAQVADRRAEEEQGRTRRRAVESLADLLVRSDTNRTGEISIAELQVAHESAIVQDLFKKIGLTMQEAKNIFSLLDYERRGRVELKRFSNSCRELVGGAKRRDIAQVEITVGTLARHLEQLDGQFSRIEAEVSSITEMADSFVDRTVRTLTGFNGNLKQHLQSYGDLKQ